MEYVSVEKEGFAMVILASHTTRKNVVFPTLGEFRLIKQGL
jgi:hypothetical protein